MLKSYKSSGGNIEDLERINELFVNARNEDKKVIIKSFIKGIEMEPNRKDIKRIVFWFLEDDALSYKDALPEKQRRTVPQIVVKQRVEVTLEKEVLKRLT